MDMLQTVIRASIDSPRMASPRYSMTWPWPPPVPIRAMTARIRSLAVTPGGSAPSTVTAMVLKGFSGSVCVASTCSTSLVPIPKAKRAERAVRRGVAVAADDRHPGLGEPELRADDVDDALVRTA